MSRILIYEARSACDDLSLLLAGRGHEVVVCVTTEELFDHLAERRPDALVFVLSGLAFDIDLLSVLRRVAPNLPIILLGGPTGLEARRRVQDLKPTYYGVFPLDPAELSDAVNGALSHGHRS